MMTLLEKNIGYILQNTEIGKNFLNRSPVAQEIDPIVNKQK